MKKLLLGLLLFTTIQIYSEAPRIVSIKYDKIDDTVTNRCTEPYLLQTYYTNATFGIICNAKALVTLKFTSDTNYYYIVQYDKDILVNRNNTNRIGTNWTSISMPILGTGSNITFAAPAFGAIGGYQIKSIHK